MDCYFHPDSKADGLCAECGRFICAECKVEWQERRFCRLCTNKVIPKAEASSKPEEIAFVGAGEIPASEPVAALPEQISQSQNIAPPLPSTVSISQEAAIPLQRRKIEVSALATPQPEPFFPDSISLKNLLSLFSLGADYRSAHRIASYVVGLFLLIAVLLLPWAVASGFGFNLTMVNGGLAAGCIIFSLLYLGATFLSYRGLRSLAHMAVAVFGILLWLIFLLTTFQEISQFAMEPMDMLGLGATLFIVACVLGIITGILEIRLKFKSSS